MLKGRDTGFSILRFTTHSRKSSYYGRSRLGDGKNLLGHKSLAMTLRSAHLAPGRTVKAVEALDSKMNKKRSIQF